MRLIYPCLFGLACRSLSRARVVPSQDPDQRASARRSGTLSPPLCSSRMDTQRRLLHRASPPQHWLLYERLCTDSLVATPTDKRRWGTLPGVACWMASDCQKFLLVWTLHKALLSKASEAWGKQAFPALSSERPISHILEEIFHRGIRTASMRWRISVSGVIQAWDPLSSSSSEIHCLCPVQRSTKLPHMTWNGVRSQSATLIGRHGRRSNPTSTRDIW